MTAALYRSDLGPGAFREAHDVLAEPGIHVGEAPLVCRWPRDLAPKGFVVFCHGLGSNGGAYAALSGYWAAHGYLVIHPTFADDIRIVARNEPELGLDPESDLSEWMTVPHARARMHAILHSPERWTGRLAVVGAVMDRLPQIVEATCGAAESPMRGAIAGHSFGAYTAQLLAGAEIDLPDEPARRFADPRFEAAVLLSAQGRDQQGLRDGSWDGLRGPMLNVTGTLDQGAKGGDWHWKCEPYELAPAGEKYLAVLEGGDHYLGGFAERHRQVPAQREAVEQITLAFLDAQLRNSQAARGWLGSIDARVGECRLLFKRK
ncbi:alpha/beta hydrolase family protein [Aquibium oceanicum]|uniref:Dienelactone hydrolase n=1 Tax=Aquibium oceanicum TaxID=1670800 RepID=A0A1L3SMW0_9HYPH|nr:hypothetical protein [Aquibium oceanicum]APH70756.1 hypothetical protein BSQ44_04675 [Aquibium oceanicum]